MSDRERQRLLRILIRERFGTVAPRSRRGGQHRNPESHDAADEPSATGKDGKPR